MIGFLDILPLATNKPNGREKSKVRANIFRLVTVPASICSKRFPMQVSYKTDRFLEKKRKKRNGEQCSPSSYRFPYFPTTVMSEPNQVVEILARVPSAFIANSWLQTASASF